MSQPQPEPTQPGTPAYGAPPQWEGSPYGPPGQQLPAPYQVPGQQSAYPGYPSPPAGYQPAASAPAPLSPSDERQWGMLAHLLTVLASTFTGLGFIAALVIYMIYKDRSHFVRRHAANALNVEIVALIGVIVSIPLMFVIVGFITLPIVMVYALVAHIVGAIKANNGEAWDPPFTPRMVS